MFLRVFGCSDDDLWMLYRWVVLVISIELVSGYMCPIYEKISLRINYYQIEKIKILKHLKLLIKYCWPIILALGCKSW